MPTFGRPTNAIAAGSSSDRPPWPRPNVRGFGRILDRSLVLVVLAASIASSGSPTTNGSRWPAATSSAHASASASASLAGELRLGSRAAAPRRWRRAGRPCRGRARRRSSRSRPSRAAWNSAASSSRFSLSALLTATMTGAVARRRSSAASRSGGVMPGHGVDDEHDDVGLGDGQPGLLLDASLDRVVRVDLEPARVDDDERRPFHSVSPYRRSRVVRARSSTIAVRWPTIRLNSVLLPTFGRPTMATTGMPACDRRRHGVRLRRRSETRGCGRKRGRPAGRRRRAPQGRARRGRGRRPAPRACRPSRGSARSTSRRSSIGVDVPPVTPTILAPSKAVGIGQVADALDLDRGRSRRSRTAGSAPWCSRSSGHRRRPSGRPRRLPRACPPGGGS